MTVSTPRKGHGKPTAAKVGKNKVGSAATAAVPTISGGKYVEATPNAYKTLTALRDLGYDTTASICDLVDNAIDAGATAITVQIKDAPLGYKRTDQNTGIIVDILDNGRGMDSPTLNQALRLGSDTEHGAQDLGKFGMGLVTASLGMARSVYVVTRQDKAQAWEATLDIDDIARHNKFLIAMSAVTQHEKVLKQLGDHGTMVRLTKVDRFGDTNVSRYAGTLRSTMAQVYRESIARGLLISVNPDDANPNVIAAADPLMRDHPETRVLLREDLSVEGHRFHLEAVELPDLGMAGNNDARIKPGNSGVYVSRNGRQIMAGQTFGLYRHHHSYTAFRAELSFSSDADTLFHVDVKKTVVLPDDRLIAKLKELLGPLIVNVGRTGMAREEAQAATAIKFDEAAQVLNERMAEPRKPAAAKDAPDPGDAIAALKGVSEAMNPRPLVKFVTEPMAAPTTLYKAVEKDGRWLITLNANHPAVAMTASARNKPAAAVLTYFVFALATATAEARGGKDIVERIGATLASVLGASNA